MVAAVTSSTASTSSTSATGQMSGQEQTDRFMAAIDEE